MTIAAQRFRDSSARLHAHFGEERVFQRYALVQDKRLGSKVWTAAETVTAKTTIEEMSEERQARVTRTTRLLSADRTPFGDLELTEDWKMVLAGRTLQIGAPILSDDGTEWLFEVDYGPQS